MQLKTAGEYIHLYEVLIIQEEIIKIIFYPREISVPIQFYVVKNQNLEAPT